MNPVRKLLRKLIIRPGTKLPVDEPPLRVAGETLSWQYYEALKEVLLPVFGVLVVAPIAAFVVSWPALAKYGFVGYLVVSSVGSLVCMSTLGILCYRTMFRVKDCRNLFLGWQAEVIVGQRLEETREDGYKVFHDIPAKGAGGKEFNLDHVAIGSGGIFVIETKGRSKSTDGGSVDVTYTADRINFPGGKYEDAPLRQVAANMKWLDELLVAALKKDYESHQWVKNGNRLPMRGIVVYPGWYVKENAGDELVCVRNEKRLVGTLRKEAKADRLTRKQVLMIANELKLYIIAHRKENSVVWTDE